MFSAHDLIVKIQETYSYYLDEDLLTEDDTDIKAVCYNAAQFIGNRKLLALPAIKLYEDDSISFVWDIPKGYLLVSLSWGEGHYSEYFPPIPMDDIEKFDPNNPTKELIDLIPFVKE